ncbi:ABC transporter permease [Streptacidiphilus sp. P02-A3a]|uniref:ABC transporter permease n=1 Tax=Streptacidiphilus sp. P02-A3a TaxID=2704468 RepID=UPI0015F9DDF1|nr:ABC transporter permease [Streptacidiphilus sp. P02-A3a]QMU73438.1 ABC transporter permease [Streptacidiphilus sp. P02-A3a]
MSALGRVVRSGVGRRRVQTLVTGLATMMAVTASVLGGSLLVASNAPFDSAFAAQHGAQLVAGFDAGRATAAQVSATAHAAGVTAASGPFLTVLIDPSGPSAAGTGAAADLGPMTVVGRATPGGAVDDVGLTAGRWVNRPGQIVLSADQADNLGPGGPVGSTLHLSGLPGDPALTVVGVARSVSASADGWVTPAEAAALTPSSASRAAGGYQMLYRFAAAADTGQVAADRAAVAAAVPAGALTGVRSWLNTKQGSDRNTALFIPFLIAFGILGVAMSVLIVGNVVAGAVGTATRRIGILKALGFTPGQVVRAHMGQALVPAAVGTALGAVIGDALTVPVLSATNQLYGTASPGVDWWVDLAAVGGALGLTAVTAWAAALRAGRLRTVEALAVGRTPRPGRGRWATRLAARLPLPRPVSLGAAHPFARPARSAALVAAIVFGTASVTFAIGISGSLSRIQAAKDHDHSDVQLLPQYLPPASSGAAGAPGTDPGSAPRATAPVAADPGAVTAALDSLAGTASYYGTADTQVGVAGVTGASAVFAFTGDASRAGWVMVSGGWFHGPGQAVVPTTFLTATGTRLGDTVTLEDHGRAVPVRIVGVVLDPHTQTMEVLTDLSTLSAAEPDLRPMTYSVLVKHGTNLTDYVHRLDTVVGPLGLTAGTGGSGGRSGTVLALDALTAALTLMLVATAAMGVLNSVVLDTRERVHDLGVHKALGMTPGQTVGMVLSSVAVIGLLGGAVGVPVGAALQALVVPAMGRGAGLVLPASVVDVYRLPELLLLGLGGLLIAALGALLPAGWAAGTRTATALRTE